MAEPLEFDASFDFGNSLNEAEQALQGINDTAAELGRSLEGAFGTATDLATALGSGAADSATQLALGLTGAADAISSVSDNATNLNEQLSLFPTFGEDAAGQFSLFADSVGTAEEAITGLADKQAEVADTVTRTTEEQDRSTQSQQETTKETQATVDVAGRLGTEFENVQAKVTEILGPLGRFSDGALSAVQSLEGVGGLAVGGLAAGAAGLLVAGESFEKASNTIALSTGATGEALDGLDASFKKTLEGSGRNAQELAQILGGLNRDTGATGDQLVGLTTNTAKFLKVTQGGVGDVRSLTQAMLSLGLGADQLTGFEDQLATVTTTFGISLSSLLQQIKTAGPALSTFGFNPGQIAGLIGEFDQAGVGLTRLVPGFTKLAISATGDGKTAQQALTDLIERIKGAKDSTAALAETQGIFSGRTAAQFSNAVRNGTIDIDKLNQKLAESPGTVSRLGTEVKTLGTQFSGIRNEILAAFGSAGLPLIEGLRDGIEQIRPTLREFFDVISTLAPAFKGFAEAAFLPIEALRLLQPPLELIDAILSHIPGPILEAVGAMAAFKLLPFGLITNGLSGILSSLGGFLALGPAGVGVAVEGVVGSIAAINPITLAAAGGIALFGFAMHEHQKDAKEFDSAVASLNKTLGETSITAADAAPKLANLLNAGSKGGLISNKDLDTLNKAGVSLDEFQKLLVQVSANPSQDITKTLRQSILDANGGIGGLIANFHGITAQAQDNAREQLKTAEGTKALTEEWLRQGTTAGEVDKNLAALERRYGTVGKAIQENAKEQIDALVKQGQVTDADRRAAAASIGLKNEKQNEVGVLDFLVAKNNALLASKLGLQGVDQADLARKGAVADGLEKEGVLTEQVTATLNSQVTALNLIAAASRTGVASNEDRIAITDKLVASGLSQEDAIKAVAKAEQELQAIQAKYPTNTADFDAALQRTFQLIGQGNGTFASLSEAAQESGVDIRQLEPAYDAFNQQLQKIAPAATASDAAMASLIDSQQKGLTTQQTGANLLIATGDNAAAAAVALDQYSKEVDASTKALDGLIPSLGTVLGKLEDQATIDFAVGPDASGALAAVTDVAKARRDGIDAEIQGLQDQKQARQDADQASIDAQKQALQDQKTAQSDADKASIDAQKATLQTQKKLDQDAAKARGEAFDSTAIDAQIKSLKAQTDTSSIDLQIKALKARTDTSDLDAQIKSLEDRQKAIDTQLERAQAAIQVFDAEEQAIRARGALQDSDLAHQQAQLAAQRDLAQQQAAAVGQAFDPTALNNRINDLQVQRDAIANGVNANIAEAQTASDRVQGAVQDAQGGLLDFGAVLDTFNAQLITKTSDAQIVASLQAQGLGDIIKVLFDPQAGISDAERSQRLAAIATLSPEERTALETKAAATVAAEKAANAAVGGVGDIFADVNPAAQKHANDRGQDLAKGLADGFVQGLSDAKINEIIDAVIKTGADPATVRKFFEDKAAAAKAALAGGTGQDGLAGVGISVDQVQAAEQALGGAGTTAGALFVQATQDAIKNTTIDPDAAAAMLAPVQDQLPIEGAAGGVSVASAAGEAIKNSPIPPDAATPLVEGLRAGLSTEGTNGGADYAIAVHGGIGLYPVPTEAGTILVASVSQALTVAGTDAGANYALSVAAGIAAKQGDAIEAAHLAAIAVDAAGHAGLEAASPSKKGLRLGGFWIDGLVKGITDGIPQVTAAAQQVTDAVAAPLPDPSRVGAGVSASATGGNQLVGSASTGGVHIENVNVTGTTNGTPDEMAEALSRKIGWLGLTGRREL